MTQTTEGETRKGELRKLVPAHELGRSEYLSEATKDYDEALELERSIGDIVKEFNKISADKSYFGKSKRQLRKKELYGEFLRAWNRLGNLSDRTGNIERISHEHRLPDIWPKVLVLSNKIRAIQDKQRPNLMALAEERKA